MARKFSGFTDGLTNQSPTDTLVGLDLSLSAANQNSYWTLNSLFSVITRNITDGAVRFGGFAAPPLSAAGAGSLYFDSGSNTFKISQNGGAYANLLSGTVTVPQGGTGLTTLTAYALLAGGTTSTGNIQQVFGVGLAGQILTSNGAAALPTWQNVAAGGGISAAVVGNLIVANSVASGTDSGLVSTQAANSVSSRKNVSDYATLAAAVAAVGSSTVTTLVIAVSAHVASSLTITKNITLQFTNSGSLALANGAIVNHYGGIDAAPNQQIFFRTGTGRIIFGGADATNGATPGQMNPASTSAQIPALYPQWWGVKGDWVNGSGGTDDTANFQAVLNVLPNDCRLVLTPNLIMKITSTLTLNNRRGAAIVGLAGGGETSELAEAQPTFMWLGADGGTIFEMGRCQNCLMQNLYISGAVVAATLTGADIGIYLNNGGGTAAGISSNNTFDRVTVYANSIRDTWIGILIGNAANGNNDEFHTFNQCTLRASYWNNPNQSGGITGTNIYIAHANVKKITFSRCNISQARYGFYCVSGSFSLEDSAIGYSMTGFYLQGWSDTLSINRIDSEGLAQLLKTVPGSDAPVRLANGRYDRQVTQQNTGTLANPFIDFGGGNNFIIENNFFGSWYQNSQATWYATSRYLFNSSGGANVWWRNNTIAAYREDFLYSNFITARQVVYNDDYYFTNPTTTNTSNVVGTQSTAALRLLIGVQQNAQTLGANIGLYACAQNSLCVGEGQIELKYVGTPNAPYIRVIGTAGSTSYRISIIARNALGNRSLRSEVFGVSTANATLSGSDYIQIDWQAVPNAIDYLVLQTDPGNASQFRLIATVTAPTTTYNLVANPAGAFTYQNPSYNETSQILRRGQIIDPVTITFTDADTTPSVAQTSQFTATNTGATTVTNFDDGVNGQTIWVLFTNANTTLQHNATVKMRSGANVTPAADTMYSFTRRSGVWYEN